MDFEPDELEAVDEKAEAMRREMLVLAQRLRERYDLDSVAILTTKQEGVDQMETDCQYATSGNAFAARHMAKRFSES